MADDYTEQPTELEPTAGFAEEIQRAIGTVTPSAAPAATAAPEPDPVLQGWEELRSRRRGRNAASVAPAEPQEEPAAGVSPLARELEETGWFAAREAEHAAERDRERQEAIRQSAEAARGAERYGYGGEGEIYPGQGEATRRMFQGILDAPHAAGVAATQIPGGAITGVGSVLQAPDVAVAGGEYGAQSTRLRQLEIASAIDRGEPYGIGAPTSALTQNTPLAVFANAYRSMSDTDRVRARADLQAEIAAFNPTPIQERTLYRAGEAVQQYGRTLIPLPEGYDEQSFSVQIGRGLGTMLAGMPASIFLGPVGGGTVFGAMGVGEATQRAVQFDRAERAAGRPGLAQEQIVLAGLLGVGPGTTDVLPVEALLGRLPLPLPLPPTLRTALAKSIARVGGQVIIEGVQEGGQQFLQNVVAWQIYNPDQVLTEEVVPNLVIGSFVGGTAQAGRETATGMMRLARRGGRAAPQPAPTPAQPAPETAAPQPAAPTPPEAAQPAAPAPAAPEAAPSPPETQGYDPSLFTPHVPAAPPEAVQPQAPAAAPEIAPEAEQPPAAAPAAPEAPPERERLTRLPTFQDALQRVPLDPDGNPDVANLQQRMQEQYGVSSWAEMNLPQKVELFRQLGVEAREREAAAAARPAALPPIPAEPEGQLREAIDRLIAERSAELTPQEQTTAIQMAEQTVERLASLEAQQQISELNRIVIEQLPQLRGQFEAVLRQRGVSEADVARLVDENVQAIGAGMQAAGVPATVEALRKYAYEEGQRQALEAVDRLQQGAVAGQAQPGAVPETVTGPAPGAGGRTAAAGGAAAAGAVAGGATAATAGAAPGTAAAPAPRAESGAPAAPARPTGAPGTAAAGIAGSQRIGAAPVGAGTERAGPGAAAAAQPVGGAERGARDGEGPGIGNTIYDLAEYARLFLEGAFERSGLTLPSDITQIPGGDLTRVLSALEQMQSESDLRPDPDITAAIRFVKSELERDRVAQQRQGQLALTAQPTPEQRTQLRSIIASRFPLNWGTIQQRLGTTPEQMEALRQEALKEGLLRQDRNGAYRRVPQGVSAQAGPELSVSPEERVEGAIRAREAQTGKPVSPAVRAYAVELLRDLGTPSFWGPFERVTVDKSLKASDVRDLAAIAGTPVSSRASKETAFKAIAKRHNDHVTFLEKQAAEQEASATLAAFASGFDMSPEARKARAEAMGFDTSRVWYHGTLTDFDRFDNAFLGNPRGINDFNPMNMLGTYLTPERSEAERYANRDDETGRVIETYIRYGRQKTINTIDDRDLDAADMVVEAVTQAKTEGYDTVILTPSNRPEAQTLIVFDPSNIRSVNAAFAEDATPVLLASFASANADGQSQRAELDALGFYSKALEAAKAWPQKKGTPEQVLQHLLKAGAGVKNEIEATGLGRFLEAKLAEAAARSKPASGRPTVRVFHGTPFADVIDVTGEHMGRASGMFYEGVGSWWNTNRRTAERYSAIIRSRDAPDRYVKDGQIFEKDIDPSRFFVVTQHPVVARQYEDADGRRYTENQAIRAAQERGLDGVAFKEDLGGDSYYVFDKPAPKTPKVTVTQDEVVSYLRENRVEVREVRYGGISQSDISMNIAVAGEEQAERGNDQLAQELDEIAGFVRTGEISIDEAIRESSPEAQQILTDLRDWAKQGDAMVAGPAKWARHSLDPSNPTYRETVLHLPERGTTPYRTFAEWMEAEYPGQSRDDAQAMANFRAAYDALPKMGDFQSGHFSEPNAIADIMSSLQVDANGETTLVPAQIQSDWSQRIRDMTRDAVAQLFDPAKPEVQARIAELSEKHKTAQQDREAFLKGEPQQWLKEIDVSIHASRVGGEADAVASALNYVSENAWHPRVQQLSGMTEEALRTKAKAFLADPRNAAPFEIYKTISALEVRDKRFRDLSKDLQSEVSAAISEARQRGEIPAGARDEKKIAELRKQNEEAVAAQRKVADEIAAFTKAHEADVEAAYDKAADEGVIDSSDSDLYVLYNFGPEALKAEVRGLADRLQDAGLDAIRIQAEFRTAEAATPAHPLVNTTDQWLTTTLRHVIRQAIAADAKSISIPSGDTVLSYNPQGSEEGNADFYDNIVPLTLRKILQGMDKSIKPHKVDTVGSPVDGRQLGNGFTVFPITDKVREKVQAEGLALFSLRSARSRLAPDEWTGSYSDIFASRLPDFSAALDAEFRRMLPTDVAIRLTDRLFAYGLPADEIVSSPGSPMAIQYGAGFRWLLGVALDKGPERAKLKGFHGIAAHILRAYGNGGLYTKEEWQILVERAKKVGIQKHLQSLNVEGTPISLWDAYVQAYTQYGAERQTELLNEELVAFLAERWAAGTSYGTKVNSLLERIAKVLEAIRNALGGLGFQTADDVFQRVVSGDIARRAEGGRREPTFEPFPYTPSPAQVHLSSEEGREARGLFPAFQAVGATSLSRSVGIPRAADPPLSSYAKDTEIKAHADYKAAKAGDREAAGRLVTDLVRQENVAEAARRFGPDAIYIPVIAEEATGKNKIPEMLAQFYAASTGAAAADDILQVSRAYHTGARPMERLIARPAFDGEVVQGGRYVLVDDVSVMGGTLAELAHFIQSNGGEVAGVVTLVNASRTGVFTPTAKQVRQIEERYGEAVREGFGVDPSALTADEAAYILNFRDADALRNSVAKARGERDQRLRAKGVRPPEAEGGEGQQLASFSDDRTPVRTGKYGSLPEEAAFRKLMGRQYEIAKASGDLSTQYDILGGRLNNDRSMPPEMREAMELERIRIAREMGPEGRAAAGIPDPDVIEGDLASFSSERPAPETRPFSIPGFEDGTVTEKVKETGERLRTYTAAGSNFILSEQPDGGWELTFFKTDDASRVAEIVAAIETDTAKPISPRGWLTPQGYQYWLSVAPDRVKFHVNAGEMFGGMWASPRAVEFAEAVLAEAVARQDDTLTFTSISGASFFRRSVMQRIRDARGEGILGQVIDVLIPAKRPEHGFTIMQGGREVGFLTYDVGPSMMTPEEGVATVELIHGSQQWNPTADDIYVLTAEIRNRTPSVTRVEGFIDAMRAWQDSGSGEGGLVAPDKKNRDVVAFARLQEASAHLSRLKSSIPQEAFQEARREERFSFASEPPRGMLATPPPLRPERIMTGVPFATTVYHGSYKIPAGATFDPAKRESSTIATFATENVDEAQDYAGRGFSILAATGRVLSGRLRANNPRVIEGNGRDAGDLLFGKRKRDDDSTFTFSKPKRDALPRSLADEWESAYAFQIRAPNGLSVTELILVRNRKPTEFEYAIYDPILRAFIRPPRVKNLYGDDTFASKLRWTGALEFEATLANPSAHHVMFDHLALQAKQAGHDVLVLRQVTDFGNRRVHDQYAILDDAAIQWGADWRAAAPGAPSFEEQIADVRRALADDTRPFQYAESAVAIPVSGLTPSAQEGFEPPLDMSPEARKARAEAMGFTREAIHSTEVDFTAFDPSKAGEHRGATLGRAVYLAPRAFAMTRRKPRSGYYYGAPQIEGARNIPVLVRIANPFVVEADQSYGVTDWESLRQYGWTYREGPTEAAQRAGKDPSPYVDLFTAAVQRAGHDGIIHAFRGEEFEYAVFDPSNIRSVNAAFDPREEGSPILLAALRGAPPGRQLNLFQSDRQPLTLQHEGTIDQIKGGKLRVTLGIGMETIERFGREGIRETVADEEFRREKRQGIKHPIPSGPVEQVSIRRGDEEVGYIQYVVISRKRKNDTAYIAFFRNYEDAAGYVRWSLAEMRQLREEFRKLNPTVKRFEGWRVSGAKAGASDAFQSVFLASFASASPPGTPPTGGPQLPATPSSQGEVRGLSDIIADLKSVLGMTVTQGLYGMRVRDRAGRRTWSFRPQPAVRGQYDAGAGVARIRISTDIDAIARAGGQHLERVFGAPMQAFLQQHAEELAVPAAPDTPLPPLNPTGYSGLELDAATQRVLIDAATNMRAWQQMVSSPRRNQAALYDVTAQAAISASTLRRRLGRTVADALVTDLMGMTGRPEADYVRDRYSATGTPAVRVAPTVAPTDISTAFADFFRRYITDPDGAKRDMPGVYTAFGEFLDAYDPAMLQDLERVQIEVLSADYKAYREATALERLKADTVSNADQRLTTRLKEWFRRNRRDGIMGTAGAITAEIADGAESLASVVYEGAIDETHPFYLITRKLLEESDLARRTDAEGRAISLAVHENPAKLIRSVGDAFKTGLRWIQDGMPSYRHGGAGFEVRTADGRVLGLRLTMTDATALQATSTDPTSIVPVAGRRSRPLRDALQLAMGNSWNYQSYENFGAYLVARRAIEEWARYQNGELERPPIKSYSDSQPANEIATLTNIISEFDRANPNFSAAAQVVYDFLWQQAIHDFQAGRLNQAELDYRATRKHFYVPYSRQMDDLLAQRGFGGRTTRFTKDQRFKGSDRAILNPIEAIIDQTFHRAAATHYNEVVGALARLMDRVGPNAGAIGERVTKREIIEANNDGFRQLETHIQGLGYDAHDAREMVRRIEADFGDTHLLVTYDPTSLGPKRPILLTLYENGERQYVRISDPEWAQHIYNSLNGIGRELTSLFIDSVATPASILRFGVTSNPAFVLPNIIRDMWSSWILTGGVNPSTWPIVTQVRGLYHEFAQTDMARLYQEAAGLMGGANVAALPKVRDKADIMALKDKGLQVKPVPLALATAAGGAAGFALAGPPGAAFGALLGAGLHRGVGKGRFTETMSQFSDISETATRLGVFTEAYKAALAWNPNLTPYQAAQEAAYVARDLIDFGRRGSKMLAAARLVPFMNAAIQGLDRAQRGLLARSDRGNAFSTTKLTGLMAAGAGAGFVIAGPVGGAVGTFAVPALATNLAARTAAVRALLAPFTKKDMGIRLSRDEERAQGQSAKTWANLLVYTLTLVAMGALFHWLTDDDEEYRSIPPRFRFRNQPVKLFGEWYMFPKAFEWAIPSNIIEAAIESQYANDPRFWERVREGLFDNLAPPGVPQVARMWGDIRANYDTFRQRPIVAEPFRTLPPELQFNAYASQFSIALAREVNKRPLMRGAVETVGGTVFGTDFELTPAIIDYALRTGLGYWGADIQRLSNVATVGASRVTDYPLIGAITRRFTFDPNRLSDALNRYWELLGREHFGFRRAAQGYKQRNEMYGPQNANEYLATLEDPEQQAYALLEASGTPYTKRQHPLNRLKGLVEATMDMERDLALERLADTSSTHDPSPIVLSPARRDEVRDALARIRAIEANNAFVTLQHRQFAARQIIDTQPALDILQAASPEAHAEYERRVGRKHVVPFSAVQNWPAERERLLEDWREAMDREAALIRQGRGRTPRRLPVGTSRPPVEQYAPQ